ncbi:MAG: glycosyltransferase family 2 protein [Chlamydiota bacterium]|nr:glycosyltransferase family 2 protein [Chlamydiota bacterium]
MIIMQLLYICVLVILSIYGVHRLYLVFVYFRHKDENICPCGLFKELPFVTVQLPFYNEKHVACRLIDTVVGLDYPRDNMEIQVLDDSDDDTCEIVRSKIDDLRQQGISITYLHRSNRIGYKAGALAEGLKSSKGDFIAVFDADFIPKADFLHKCIHYFMDPSIGMVQTRWTYLNRRYSLLTRAQAILLDGHFVIEHTARHRSMNFFNFNGTAGIWRKNAILVAGGWQGDTLTEDLDLSYRAQLQGWKFMYLLDVTAPSELPITVQSFKRQQHRWSKGTIQTAKKILGKIWKSGIPLRTKIEASFHLTGPLTYVLALILFVLFPSVLMNPFHVHAYWTQILLFDMPVFLLSFGSMCTFYAYAQIQLYPSRITHLKYVPLAVMLGIGMSVALAKAALEAFVGYQSPFIRTLKLGFQDKGQDGVVEKRMAKEKLDTICWIEFGLGVYFLIIFMIAFYHQMYARLPIILLFVLSFFSIWWLQVLPLFQRIGKFFYIERFRELLRAGTISSY